MELWSGLCCLPEKKNSPREAKSRSWDIISVITWLLMDFSWDIRFILYSLLSSISWLFAKYISVYLYQTRNLQLFLTVLEKYNEELKFCTTLSYAITQDIWTECWQLLTASPWCIITGWYDDMATDLMMCLFIHFCKNTFDLHHNSDHHSMSHKFGKKWKIYDYWDTLPALWLSCYKLLQWFIDSSNVYVFFLSCHENSMVLCVIINIK